VDSPAEDAPTPDDGTSSAAPVNRNAVTAGKGRPTPKRSEAERRRRPVSAPGDRKAANRQARDRQRQDRARRQQGMQRGEQWAMPPRDRGPVKALARDYVDSRRRLSEFYMYGLLVLLALLFVRSTVVQSIVPVVVVVAVLIMLVEGIFIGRQVRALAEKRLPGESTQGVRLYAAMRALQIRQLRMPKPRIKPGESF
jgi:Flp pilus assembly protein TadB